MLDINRVVFPGQSGTASFKTRSRSRGCRALSATTSTLRPSSSETSIRKPPSASPVRPCSSSTSKSTSLAGSASPRDLDPNNRTLRTPRRRASSRICFLLRAISVSMRLSYSTNPVESVFIRVTCGSVLDVSGQVLSPVGAPFNAWRTTRHVVQCTDDQVLGDSYQPAVL